MGEHKDIYFEKCKIIVENKGKCGVIICDNCPFSVFNNGYEDYCDKIFNFHTITDWKDLEKVKIAQKYLDGSIVFHKGKLVEVEED